MADFVSLTIRLEPAIDELLGRIAEEGGTTKEALAAEAVNDMVAWVLGADKEIDPEQERLQSQLSFIQDTLDEFEG